MHTFFHCWRRKAGCIALVMALAFGGAWIRSTFILDKLYFEIGPREHKIVSLSGHLTWWSYDIEDSLSPVKLWVSKAITQDAIALGDGVYGRYRPLRWSIAYWPIVVSLTLLSAYLILWRPPKSYD